jgi:hypothetical protein
MYATRCSHISAIFIHKYTLFKRGWICVKLYFVICDIYIYIYIYIYLFIYLAIKIDIMCIYTMYLQLLRKNPNTYLWTLGQMEIAQRKTLQL